MPFVLINNEIDNLQFDEEKQEEYSSVSNNAGRRFQPFSYKELPQPQTANPAYPLPLSWLLVHVYYCIALFTLYFIL